MGHLRDCLVLGMLLNLQKVAVKSTHFFGGVLRFTPWVDWNQERKNNSYFVGWSNKLREGAPCTSNGLPRKYEKPKNSGDKQWFEHISVGAKGPLNVANMDSRIISVALGTFCGSYSWADATRASRCLRGLRLPGTGLKSNTYFLKLFGNKTWHPPGTGDQLRINTNFPRHLLPSSWEDQS